HRRVADHAGKLGEHWDRFLYHRRIVDLGMPRHGADLQRAALELDAGQALDAREVDQLRRTGEAKLHRRQQRVAAGKEFGVGILGEGAQAPRQRLRTMEGEGVHCSPPFSSPASRRMSAGRENYSVTPRAASTGPTS